MPNAMKLVCVIPCSTFLRRESILLGWFYGVVVVTAWPESTPSMLHRHISSQRRSQFGQEMHCGKAKLLQMKRRHRRKIKGINLLLLLLSTI